MHPKDPLWRKKFQQLETRIFISLLTSPPISHIFPKRDLFKSRKKPLKVKLWLTSEPFFLDKERESRGTIGCANKIFIISINRENWRDVENQYGTELWSLKRSLVSNSATRSASEMLIISHRSSLSLAKWLIESWHAGIERLVLSTTKAGERKGRFIVLRCAAKMSRDTQIEICKSVF